MAGTRGRRAISPVSDPIASTIDLAEALESAGVPYLIGGSLASSLHGLPRTTQDGDAVIDVTPTLVDALLHALHPAFDVDEASAREAVRTRSSFNVFHRATMFKFDLFLLRSDGLGRSEMDRRHRAVLPAVPDRPVAFASAEDTVLRKLEWFRMGGEVSERQWIDVRGVLDVQGDRLDLDYLRTWADRIAVRDLLDRALSEAGLA